MPITLPREPIPAISGSPRILTIYGPPKVGKTTLLSVLPKSLIVDLEDGSDYVTATKIKLDNALQIKPLIEEIIRQGKPYDYLSIDTIDQVETWAEQEATRLYKSSIMGKNFSGDSVLDLPKGAGYQMLRNVFRKFFDMLRMGAPNVIFVGHVRDKDINNTMNTSVSSKDLDLTGKIRNIVCSLSDAIGHVYRNDKGQLIISFETTENVQCGSRCEHLRGKKFTFSTPTVKDDWKNIYTNLQ